MTTDHTNCPDCPTWAQIMEDNEYFDGEPEPTTHYRIRLERGDFHNNYTPRVTHIRDLWQ